MMITTLRSWYYGLKDNSSVVEYSLTSEPLTFHALIWIIKITYSQMTNLLYRHLWYHMCYWVMHITSETNVMLIIQCNKYCNWESNIHSLIKKVPVGTNEVCTVTSYENLFLFLSSKSFYVVFYRYHNVDLRNDSILQRTIEQLKNFIHSKNGSW